MDPEPEPIGLYALAYYLQRIRTFIESDKNTLSFPNISSNLQDVLVKIVTSDAEFLNRLSNNNNVKLEAAKLAAVRAESKVKLIHDFCDGKHGPNVLMYKKVAVETFKAPEPLRKPKEMDTKSNNNGPQSDSLVTSYFKTRSLNVTIKFIKDDTQLLLKYLPMSPSQAEFLMNILLQGKEGKIESTDEGYGFKSIYAALWESMKINRLKYEYKIEYVPTLSADMKQVVFEKIPKFKVVEKMEVDVPQTHTINLSSPSSSISSNTSAVSSKPIQNENKTKQVSDTNSNNHSPTSSSSTSSSSAESLKPKAVQNIIDQIQANIKSSDSSSAISITSRMRAGCLKLKSEKKVKQKQDKMKNKIMQVINKLGNMIQSRSITEEFIEDSLQQISDFMFDEEQASLTFIQMEWQEQFFFKYVEMLCKEEGSYMLFTGPCQKLLANIKYCMSKNILYEMRLIKNNGKPNKRKKITVRDVILEKLARFTTQGLEKEMNETNNVDPPTLLIAPISQDLQEKLMRFKAIKDDVVQTSGEGYILDCLKQISNFLLWTAKSTLEFRCSTHGQALFIKYVHTLSKLQECYQMFSEGGQDLLRKIQMDAQRYKLSFQWMHDVENDNCKLTKVVLKKKLAGRKKAKNTAFESLSDIHLNESCMECCERNVENQNNELMPKNSLKKLYVACCQKMEKKDQTAMQRSRSLSASRRDRRNPVMTPDAKAEPRGTSSQRPLTIKEKLIEGLNQPVQSDKAMKMMQNMGWTGGALGLRGEGIMEPIMPAIEPGNRAGFGHVSSTRKVAPKVPKPRPEARSSNSLIQGTSELLPQGIKPVSSLPPSLIPTSILTGLTSTSQVKTIYLDENYHIGVLKAILEMVTTEIEMTIFIYVTQKVRFPKIARFIKHATTVLNYRKNMCLSNEYKDELVANTLDALENFKNLKFSTKVQEKTIIMIKTTKQDLFQNLMETTDAQEPQPTENKVSQPNNQVSQPTENQVLSATISHRHWYSPKNTTFGLSESQNDAEPHDKLLADMLKPRPEQSTMKPTEICTPNAIMPSDLERMMFYYTLNIPRDVRIPKEIVETKTTIAQVPSELKRVCFVQDIPADMSKSKKTKTTHIPNEQTVKTTIAQKIQEMSKTISQKPVDVTTKNTQELKTTTDSLIKLTEIKQPQRTKIMKKWIDKRKLNISVNTTKTEEKLKKIAFFSEQSLPHEISKPKSMNASKSQEMKTTIMQKSQDTKINNAQMQPDLERRVFYYLHNIPRDIQIRNEMVTTNTQRIQANTTIMQIPLEIKTTIPQMPSDLAKIVFYYEQNVPYDIINTKPINTPKCQESEITIVRKSQDTETTTAQMQPDLERPVLYNLRNIPRDIQIRNEMFTTNTQRIQANTMIMQKPMEIKTKIPQMPSDLAKIVFYYEQNVPYDILNTKPINTPKCQESEITIVQKSQDTETTTAQMQPDLERPVLYNLRNIPRDIQIRNKMVTTNTQIIQTNTTITQTHLELKTKIVQMPPDLAKLAFYYEQNVPYDILKPNPMNTTKSQEAKITIVQKSQDTETTTAQMQPDLERTVLYNLQNIPRDIQIRNEMVTTNTQRIQANTTITQTPLELNTKIAQMPPDLAKLVFYYEQNVPYDILKQKSMNTLKSQDAKITILQKSQHTKRTTQKPLGLNITVIQMPPDLRELVFFYEQNLLYYILKLKTKNSQKSQAKTTNTQMQQYLEIVLYFLQNIPRDIQTATEMVTTNNQRIQARTTIKQKRLELNTAIAQILPDLIKIVVYCEQNLPYDILKPKTTNTPKSQETKTINVQMQPILERTMLYHLQNILRDTRIPKEMIAMNTRKMQAETTITPVPVDVAPTNAQTSQELKATTTVLLPKTTHNTEIQKSQCRVLLEKFSANNNDLTQNKNDTETVKKDVESNHNSTATVNQTTIRNTPTSTQPVTNNATTVKEGSRIIDYIDLTDDDINETDGNTGIQTVENDVMKNDQNEEMNTQPDYVDDTGNNETQTLKIDSGNTVQTENQMVKNSLKPDKTIKVERNVQNDIETVTYFIPIKCQTTVETNIISTGTNEANLISSDKTESHTHLNDNYNKTDTFENDKCTTNDIKETDSLLDYESDAVIDDFSIKIEINSEDEDYLLVSENETDPEKALGNKIIEPPLPQGNKDTIGELKNVIQSDLVKVNVKIEKDDFDLASLQDRKRPSLSSPEAEPTKKCKLLTYYKKLYILHKDYPNTKIDNNMACEIQTAILKVIDYKKEVLPLLICQGIQNGGLIYSCQDEKSVLLMEDLIKTTEDLKIVYEFDVKEKLNYKMAFRMNTFIEEPIGIILSRLEIYNNGLSVTKWSLIKKEQYCDFVVIYVDIDEGSFNYICNANFVLYGGYDCAKFTIIWE